MAPKLAGDPGFALLALADWTDRHQHDTRAIIWAPPRPAPIPQPLHLVSSRSLQRWFAGRRLRLFRFWRIRGVRRRIERRRRRQRKLVTAAGKLIAERSALHEACVKWFDR